MAKIFFTGFGIFMRIQNINLYRPYFKAHFYDVDTSLKKEFTIKTDNKPYLGDEPYYCQGGISNTKMKKDSEYFTQSIIRAEDRAPFNYKINFNDTDKIDDNNGKGYFVDPSLVTRKAIIYDKILHRQPLVNIISNQTARGKFLVTEDYNSLDCLEEPSIVMTQNVSNMLFPNVRGHIFTNASVAVLSHEGANLNHLVPVAMMIYDDNLIEKIKKYNGKYIEIDASSTDIKIREISKEDVPLSQSIKKISVPKLDYVNHPMLTGEYTENNVGKKAYNLMLLENMVCNGKLKGVTVPKSFAVPWGFIELLRKNNSRWDKEADIKYEKLIKEQEEGYESDIRLLLQSKFDYNEEAERYTNIKILEDYYDKAGLSGRNVMVRSAFNTEDNTDISAAGFYHSKLSYYQKGFNYDLLSALIDVANSNWEARAVNLQKLSGVSPADAIPTVIIQDYINADYKFTVYTEDKNGKLRIELLSNGNINKNDPYVITYNKETKKISVEAVERKGRTITFDENLNIVYEDKITDEINDNIDLYKPMICNLIKNALIIEKEFGAPQDIEGGFKNGEIYLWQTRNIVK